MAKSPVSAKSARTGIARKPSRAKVLAKSAAEKEKVSKVTAKEPTLKTAKTASMPTSSATKTPSPREQQTSKYGVLTKPFVKRAPSTSGTRRKVAIRAPDEFVVRKDERSITVLVSKEIWEHIQVAARENEMSGRLLLNTVIDAVRDQVPEIARSLRKRIDATKKARSS